MKLNFECHSEVGLETVDRDEVNGVQDILEWNQTINKFDVHGEETGGKIALKYNLEPD